jgi:acyl dehydratase
MEKLTFESVKLGDALPQVQRKVDQETLWRYAVGSLDYNPVHSNPDWVKEAKVFGIPSTVGHGAMTMSLMTTVVCNWAFPVGGWLRTLDTKFVKPVLPGDTLTFGGEVTEIHPGRGKNKNYVVVELTGDNQKGEKIAVGHAEVMLP